VAICFILGALALLGFAVLLVVGLAIDRSAMLEIGIVLLVLGSVFLATGSWLVNRQRQITSATSNAREQPVSSGRPSENAAAQLPAAHLDGKSLARRKCVALSIALTILVIPIAGLMAFYLSNWVSVVLVVVGSIALGTLIFWIVLIPTLFLKPQDIEALAEETRPSVVWVSTTSAGLRTYVEQRVEESVQPVSRLRQTGYLVLAAGELSLWQSDSKQLHRIFRFPVASIKSAEVSSVSWAFVVQKGVRIVIEDDAGEQLTVPLLPSNVALQEYGQASDQLAELLREAISEK
jgi:hypothetical protein